MSQLAYTPDIGTLPVTTPAPCVGGSTGLLTWDGTGDMPEATGVSLLFGETGSVVEGQLWKKLTDDTNNTDWVAL